MATTASGVTIPGSSPTTTAATPLEDHFNNLGKSLNGHIVVPVANVTARAALITALAAEGYTPSTARPVYVERADAGAGRQLEKTVDGTNWVTFFSAAVADVDGTLFGAGFDANWTDFATDGSQRRCQWFKSAEGMITLSGLAKVVTTVASTATPQNVATLPVGARPGAPEMFLAHFSTAANGLVKVDISTAGLIRVSSPVAATSMGWPAGQYLSLGGITFKAA